jgi:hypothetical protein
VKTAFDPPAQPSERPFSLGSVRRLVGVFLPSQMSLPLRPSKLDAYGAPLSPSGSMLQRRPHARYGQDAPLPAVRGQRGRSSRPTIGATPKIALDQRASSRHWLWQTPVLPEGDLCTRAYRSKAKLLAQRTLRHSTLLRRSPLVPQRTSLGLELPFSIASVNGREERERVLS